MKRQHILLPAVLILLLLPHLTFGALPRYEIIDLGTLGGYSSSAHAINDAGQVVGMGHTTNHEIRAFLWDPVNGMIDLGTIGNLCSIAGGINNNEQVVGALSIPGGIPRAFIWDSATGMVELGASAASSINNAGQIAGEFLTVYDPAVHGFRSHACIWDSANDMIDLGTLGNPCPNSTCPDYSCALGINDAGQVVGYSSTTSGEVHAFLWDSNTGMRDLGTLGGTRSWASAINNDGHIVGNSYSVDDKYSSMHAFLWDSSTGMRDLGTLGGNISKASAINDHGQVVGYSYTIDNDYDSIRAFVWDSNNGMVPLDEMLHADCELTELRPQAINNRGQIVGYGINETLQRRAAFLMTPIPPKVIYVDDDATGANDGSSWDDAYNYFQDALVAAYSGDEIRVAQGIYKPDQGIGITPGDRTATFQLKTGVVIKGGYAGFGEPDPNVRDIHAYETILCGDMGIPGDDSENSYHVVTASGTDGTAVLDGFTITAGNANGQWSTKAHSGGGMFNDGSSPKVTNCKFLDNSARYCGGGMYNYTSSPTLTNCKFSDNCAAWGVGGGMVNASSSPILTNCTFTNNSAVKGGGMYNYIDTGPGGFEPSNPTLTNCIFSINLASENGGGMCNSVNSHPTLTNCTFAANSAINGNALACDSYQQKYPSNVQMTNCILWDGGDEIWNNDGSTITITYSDVQGSWPGEGNIDTDPRFVDPGYWDANDFWVDGDYRLLPDSPCIDAGYPGYVPEPNETDLDGWPRIIGSRIDMGAYEYNPPIPAEVRITPSTINPVSKGRWITCYIWLAEGYDVNDIDCHSLLLEYLIEPEQLWVDEKKQVVMARFSREEVQAILDVGEVELTITGQFREGTLFEGSDVIRVIDKGGGKN